MNKRSFARLILAGLAVLMFFSTFVGADRQKDTLRILLFTGRNNHNWRATTPVLEKIYEDSGRFVVDVTEEPSKCTAELLEKYDVIVSNWCAWPDVKGRQWGPVAEKAFLDFIAEGKGFALFHAAGATFHDWPEFQQIAGATWQLGKTGHGPAHQFKVEIENAKHPVTRGMSDFLIRDELWHQMGMQKDIEVLCSAFSSKQSKGSGQSEPVVICTRFGKGRCFYNILGHDAKVMSNVAWQSLMLRGTEWAATGNVTIPVPDDWPSAEKQAGEFTWKQSDKTLALQKQGKVVWQFNFDKSRGKPYFHPVCLTDGTELTWLRPPDHIWHRALWFAWKSINGLNYWEEDRTTGLSQGRTEITDVKLTPHDDSSAQIEITLSYHPPEKPAVLTEKRMIDISAPDDKGRYRMDWQSTFTAGAEDVLLNRTPIPGEKGGKAWGGYAGLSVRLAKGISKCQVLDSEGRKDMAAHGKNARWMDFNGQVAPGKTAGIAIFDHPKNLRHPSPWYVSMNAKIPFGYFSPAPLFNEPYTLKAGQSLALRYRILIHPDRANKKSLDAEWKNFTAKNGN